MTRKRKTAERPLTQTRRTLPHPIPSFVVSPPAVQLSGLAPGKRPPSDRHTAARASAPRACRGHCLQTQNRAKSAADAPVRRRVVAPHHGHSRRGPLSSRRGLAGPLVGRRNGEHRGALLWFAQTRTLKLSCTVLRAHNTTAQHEYRQGSGLARKRGCGVSLKRREKPQNDRNLCAVRRFGLFSEGPFCSRHFHSCSASLSSVFMSSTGALVIPVSPFFLSQRWSSRL